MTTRELFQSIMNFEPVDRIPVWDLEGITEGALRQWVSQGFPAQMNASDHFGLEHPAVVPLDDGPIPSFVARILHEDDEWITTVDRYGTQVRTQKKNRVTPTIYYYEKFAVESREDWEQMKGRHDAADSRRYPSEWSQELLDYYAEIGRPVMIRQHWGPGRGPKSGCMMGLENFLELCVDDPALAHDVFSFWAEFLIELLRPVLTGTAVDYFFFMEDGIAYKNSTVIGPDMYRKLWMPYMKRVCDFLRDNGVNLIGHYTSGNIEPLIPAYLETGINLFAPLEVATDMDAVKLRKEYGRDVLLMGNIGRQALMDGPAAVEREFNAKVPWLMEQGGYIPAVDDMILPDISFAAYSKYIELVKGFGGG